MGIILEKFGGVSRGVGGSNSGGKESKRLAERSWAAEPNARGRGASGVRIGE